LDFVLIVSYRVFPTSQITFVGTVVNIAKSPTNISSTIEDGTGSIDVRQWIDTADDDTGKMAGIE
jgi:replication factor A2